MEKPFSDSEWETLVGIFSDESLDMLDEVEPKLVALEKQVVSGEPSPADINYLFRLFHSLKGSAASLHLGAIRDVTHCAESLLAIFRSLQKKVTPAHIDLLCETCDCVRDMIKKASLKKACAGLTPEASRLITRLTGELEPGGTGASPQGTPAPVAVVEAKTKSHSPEVAKPVEPKPPRGLAVPTDPRKTVEPPKPAKEASPEDLPEQTVPGISGEPLPDMASTKSVSSPVSSGSLNSSESLKSPPEECAGSLEELRISITPDMVAKFCEEAVELFEDAEQALLVFENAPEDDQKVSQAFRALHSFKGNSGFFGYHQLEQLSHAAEEVLDGIREERISFDQATVSLVLSAIDALRESVRRLRADQVEHVDGLPELMERLRGVAHGDLTGLGGVPKLGEILLDRGMISKEALDEALSVQEELADHSPPPGVSDVVPRSGDSEAGQRQAIRVDTEKLDRLVDLVGELIIAQSNVAHCPDLLNLRLERFSKELDRLNKVTRELQQVSMSIRMIPIAGLFRRLIRPVRDLARSLGKEITLGFQGEDTEVDKSLIELLSDPLMHIVRNAADHGIESSADRVAAGKPASGKIILEARHSGSEVWISVHDDGRGLDRRRIFAKAVTMGLLAPENERITDSELFQLIFEPGFSTAQQVTEISGRGVGMDVVKKNIEKLKGVIEISSQPGLGSHFRMRIPLTLAIIDGMVVQIGKERFVVPTQTIVEFFRPPVGALTTVTGTGEAVMLRNSLIAFHRLGAVLGIRDALEDPYQAQVMVVEAHGRKVGLMVDFIIGQQQTVIKSLGPNFHTIPGISGAAVMSDGKVGLILDPSGLVKVAEGYA
jgi:two-component system chemotaxis sensor kinase CheA